MVVHHHRAVLDVLARIGEVDAQHIQVALRAAEVLVHTDADHVAAERDHRVTQAGVLAHMDAVAADMLGALLPLLDEGGGQVGIAAGDDLHTLRETCHAVVFDDDVGMGAGVGRDDQVQRIRRVAAAGDRDAHRLGDVAVQGHDGRGLHDVPFDRGDAVARLGHGAARRDGPVHDLDADLRGVQRRTVDAGHLDRGQAARLEHIEEFGDAVQRRVPPLLLTGGRHRERVKVEAARRTVRARRHGRRHRVRVVRIRHGNGDFGFLCHRTQPTDPSICSSTKRFSSSAYSIGSSRLIGSTKPRTIMPIASSSFRPRLIR